MNAADGILTILKQTQREEIRRREEMGGMPIGGVFLFQMF